MIKNNILMKVIPEKTLCRIFTCILISLHTTNSYAQSGGVIILNQPTPATAVRVTATEQIVLKPGFQTSASRGNFSAKISSSNSIVPLIDIAQESPFQIPVASNDQNYIKTSTPLLADINSPVMTTIQYFDGLGRPSQTVQMGITPEGADLVLLTQYDDVGREWKNWLPTPIEGNFGQYVNESSFTSNASSKHNDNNPYAENRYESSPLNRVKEQFGAGANWHTNNKRVVTNYSTNDSNIVYFHINESGNLARNGNYNAATLYKTTVSDEDGKPVSEYKDKLGRIVLNEGADTRTYYVYNDLGQLSYVIPPIAADSLPNTTGPIYDNNGVLKRYAYLYKYDERGNQIYKRLPGCEPIRMVYDKANRLILSQDGNQKLKQQWLVNKYDVLGRLLYTGIIEDSIPHEDLIADLRDEIITESWNTDVDIDNTGYTCGTFTPGRLLTVNYYDNYSFVSLTDNSLNYDAGKENEYGYKYASAKGLLTGTRTYLLDGSNNYTATALYSDYKGQMIQSRSSNHLGGHYYVYNQYNFNGNVTKTLKEHNIDGQSTVTELYEYDYDHAMRPTTVNYTLNNNDRVLLASNKYDELGRLVEKKRHSNADTEQFEYNIRGWATKIKSGDFEQNLLYHTGLPQGATACYNGNIAASTYTYNGNIGMYIYSYDNLNRLRSALSPGYNSRYMAEEFSYDKHGNISSLFRWSENQGIFYDALGYRYRGNQVVKIDDEAGSSGLYNVKEYHDDMIRMENDFDYDANGNMISDYDRDIVTIKYNSLNLPDTIQFKNGNQIINSYDASGQKLKSLYITNTSNTLNPILNTGEVFDWNNYPEEGTYRGTAYVNNFEYGIEHIYATQSQTYVYNYSLDRATHIEGYTSRINSAVSDPIYSYYRRDHLGNNREVWQASYGRTVSGGTTENVPATTIQRTQYYPSGLPWRHNSGDNPDWQPYKYNGKEFVEMHGLDEYDSEARWYYPAIMRTTTPDPLAEKYYDVSPYAWCGNNPILFIDLDGREPKLSGPVGNYFKNLWGFYKNAYQATTVTVSAGLQVGLKLDVAKTGFAVQANLISGELDVLDNGKLSINNTSATQGAEININVAGVGVGVGTETSVKDNGNGTATKTETIKAFVGVVESGVKTTTEHKENRNGTYAQTSKKTEIVKPSVTLDAKAQALVGVQVKVDVGKVWQGFKDFVKNTFKP